MPQSRQSSGWRRWLPTSKVTAVGGVLVLYALSVTYLVIQYDVVPNVLDVVWNAVWIGFLAGYMTTEHRGM